MDNWQNIKFTYRTTNAMQLESGATPAAGRTEIPARQTATSFARRTPAPVFSILSLAPAQSTIVPNCQLQFLCLGRPLNLPHLTTTTLFCLVPLLPVPSWLLLLWQQFYGLFVGTDSTPTTQMLAPPLQIHQHHQHLNWLMLNSIQFCLTAILVLTTTLCP